MDAVLLTAPPSDDTTMGDAFRRAGHETPRDRVDRIVRGAVERHGNQAMAVVTIARALEASNVAVVWEFFKPDRDTRLWREVDAMFAQIRRERGLDKVKPKADPGGQQDDADEAASPSPPGAADGGHPIGATSHTAAAAVAPLSPAIRRVARDSLLATIMINGRPIGECTAAMALDWSFARGKEARFARLIAEGVPANGIIGEYKTEEDAAQCLKLSQEAENEWWNRR